MGEQPPKKKIHVLRTVILLAVGGGLLLCVIIATSMNGGDDQPSQPTAVAQGPIENAVAPTTAATATPVPVLALTPAEFRAKWDALTEVQQKAWAAEITGQRIHWTCAVFEVREGGNLTLKCETGEALTGLMVRGTIPEADAAKYNKGQSVTFEATIQGIETFLLFAIKVGPIAITD